MYFSSAVLLICLDLHDQEIVFKLERLFHQHREKEASTVAKSFKGPLLQSMIYYLK